MLPVCWGIRKPYWVQKVVGIRGWVMGGWIYLRARDKKRLQVQESNYLFYIYLGLTIPAQQELLRVKNTILFHFSKCMVSTLKSSFEILAFTGAQTFINSVNGEISKYLKALWRGLKYTDFMVVPSACGDNTLVLKTLGGWSTSPLPLLPDPLWIGEVVPVRVPSIGQIHLFKNY